MKRKIRRTVYFTNHPRILKRLEIFAKKHKITTSATILGFCALGMMYQDTEILWRKSGWSRGNV